MLTLADLANHPVQVIFRIQSYIPPFWRFNFSYYAYVPQTLEDSRHPIQVESGQLTRELMMRLLLGTPQGMELALHSSVVPPRGNEMHIPMVDLATRVQAEISKVDEVLPLELRTRMEWYKSGRSFHGYGYALISRLAWEQMMGRLLLANKSDARPVVDPRWIGHRLLAGYAALRLTKNTSHYLAHPQLVRRAKNSIPYVSDIGPLGN